MKMIRFLAHISLFCVITLGVYLIFEDFSILKLNTADASTYLNIAENIVSQKGFVVSFNLYQYFKALYHPLWPYMQPVYPLLCSVIFLLHGGIEQVIKINILILGLNAALIYYIIQRYVPSILNNLFLVWLIFSLNFFYTALFPWTEQLHLFLFLISFILFLRFPDDPRGLFCVGALNGLLFLTRVAQIYSIFAFVLCILLAEGNNRQKLKGAIFFVIGLTAVLLPYQIFNWTFFHAFYPEYIKPAADYNLAIISNMSTYKQGHTGFYNPLSFGFSIAHFRYFFDHIIMLCKDFYFFFILSIVYLIFFRQNKERVTFVLNCICQSVFIVLGYSYSFSWNPSLETSRYSLVPFVLISMAGWFCFYQLFFSSGIKPRKLFVVAVLIMMVYFSIFRYFEVHRAYMQDPRWENPFYIDLYASCRWIDQNLPKDVLIASNDDQEGYFMHRPFISMPPGKSYNCENLRLFNHIYSPDYYLLSLAVPDNCFSQIPHAKIYFNKGFRVLKIINVKE